MSPNGSQCSPMFPMFWKLQVNDFYQKQGGNSLISEISPVASRQYLSGVFLVNAFSRWPRPETIFPWSLPEHNLQRFTGRVQQEIFFLCFLVVSTRILRDIFQSFMVASTRTIFIWWRPPEKQKGLFLMYSSKLHLPEHRGRQLSDTDIQCSLLLSNIPQCTTMYNNAPQCFITFANVFQCFYLFLNVPKCPSILHNICVSKSYTMFPNVHLQCSSIFLNVSQSFFFLTSLCLYFYPRLFRTFFFVFFFKSLP